MSVKHTELPWCIGRSGRSIIREVPGLADGYDHFMIAVASAHSLVSVEESKANAQLIVTAVNTYPVVQDLVDALERVVNVSASGADTISFLVDLRSVAVECADALARFNALSAEKDQ